MAKRKPTRPAAEFPPDFPNTMSSYERESRIAEAKLAEARKKEKLRKKAA
jgi:hypothetical protein